MAYAAHNFTYGLGEIVARCGQVDRGGRPRTLRWQIAYVTALIAEEGFPPPLPLKVGTSLVKIVKPASKWSQGQVDRWFDDRCPPGTHGDAIARRQGERDMDDRAVRIGLRLVGGSAAA